MYRSPNRRKELIRRTLVYSTMSIMVGLLVTVLTFLILGYRIDINNGQVERVALIQLVSKPSGASVLVDNADINTRTSGKYSVIEGTHNFSFEKNGYETWQKTIDVKADDITWLDYVRLIPVERTVQPVSTYSNLISTLPTADGKRLLIQQDKSKPLLQLVDVSGGNAVTSSITIDKKFYTTPKPDVKHIFTFDQWDISGRYLLAKHSYGSQHEWLVIDTRDATKDKNITRTLDVNIDKISFSGTNGNIMYVLTDGDIRKLDMSAETMSGSLVKNVIDFKLYNTNVITYVGYDQSSKSKKVVGLYRDGDSSPHVLRTVVDPNTPLAVDTTRYFNKDYVAIAEGKNVDILMGSYPTPGSIDNSSLNLVNSFSLKADVSSLSFSKEGEYLLAQSSTQFAGFNNERQTVGYVDVPSTSGQNNAVKWLDDSHLWSSFGGYLVMYDFDGTNAITINPMVGGFAALLSQDEKYIYSIGKVKTGYQLQRVKIIL